VVQQEPMSAARQEPTPVARQELMVAVQQEPMPAARFPPASIRFPRQAPPQRIAPQSAPSRRADFARRAIPFAADRPVVAAARSPPDPKDAIPSARPPISAAGFDEPPANMVRPLPAVQLHGKPYLAQ